MVRCQCSLLGCLRNLRRLSLFRQDVSPGGPHLRALGDNRLPFTRPKIAGITINVSSVEDIMPPIIGTAIRCMISDPVPVLT